MPWTKIPAAASTPSATPSAESRILSYADAVREGLSQAMEADPNVVVLGQGVEDQAGAMFGTTRGLATRFGANRVSDTPVSEECMTGVCVGAAMEGLRPVLMHNRPDFLLLSMNQIVSHAAKFHFMDNGQTRVPLVIWAAIGRGWGSGPQHTQAIHGMLAGVPGLKIIMPTTPGDAKGLLISAIADNNPVLIFEHRWLMRQLSGDVPERPYRIPIGKAAFRKRGNDLTVVACSHAVQLALDALDLLERKGRAVSADVIDLRTIKPLDEEAILGSVERTGRLLVVDTAWRIAGVSAEVGCLVAEKGFRFLKRPIRRLGFPDLPAPAGHVLESAYYPDAMRIAGAIEEALT